MIASEIISRFETQVDDMTELSSVDELILLNKIYKKILAGRPYEFLKKAFSGTQSTAVPYVALPSDFCYLSYNNNYTEDNQIAKQPVVFVQSGSAWQPYKIISYSDRRQYRDKTGYAYIDIVNSRLVFTSQPTSAAAIEFDYIYDPANLTASDAPIIPERFQWSIVYGMAVDDDIIQKSDKAKSYAAENQGKYNSEISDLNFWNARLIIQ